MPSVRQPLIVLFVALTGAAALAQGVPLPRERPAEAAPASASVPVPRERPSELAGAASGAPAEMSSASDSEVSSVAASSVEPAASSSIAPPPPAEPRVYQTGCPAALDGEVTAKALPPIHEGQCGVQSPLSLEAITANGRSIALNAPVVTDCGMASALPGWLGDVDAYVFAHEKTRIKTLLVGTGYDCRNVDHAATGNLSFHAFADAIDVIGFTLEDGRKVTIAPGYNGSQAQGHDVLHFARDAACTRFTTVLGPDADAFHQDNLHIDLGCHGKACTARLCE